MTGSSERGTQERALNAKRNKADLSGSNAQGEYIFSEKTEREQEKESRREVV